MAAIAKFTFNPFQENTYIISDESGECVIIDPGCYTTAEQEELAHFIRQKDLKPVLLINTHCHIDHILGNQFVFDRWGLLPVMHKDELPLLLAAADYGSSLGIAFGGSPGPERFFDDGEVIQFGQTKLETIVTPGHSPAGTCLYCKADGFIVVGDTLFRSSIGRTDLPGGDTTTLMQSIKNKLMVLPEDTIVYAGHMQNTTIGEEKRSNPFVLAYEAGQPI